MGLPPHRICTCGIARTFQITQPFARLSVLENIMVGAYHTTRTAVKPRPRRRMWDAG